jgi:hypothetical protein
MLEKIISIFGIIFATLKRNWKEMGQVSLGPGDLLRK